MCRLILDETKYNNKESYWKAIIMNNSSFTINDLMKNKDNFSEADIRIIFKIISEMNDAGFIKKYGDKFYVMESCIF